MTCPLSNHILDAIEERFTGAEQEWAIALRGPDGDTGPSAQLVPLGELRKALLNSDADDAMKDAVWAELTRLCQERGGDWQLAAIWMMLPALRKAVWRWQRTGTELRETEAEAVAGFIEAISTADPQRARLGSRLVANLRHLAKIAARERMTIPVADTEMIQSRQEDPMRPKDLLADAVHEGVLTVPEADLISRTRLEGERLGAVAQQLGLRYHACRQRRARAEGRLAGYVLIDGNRHPVLRPMPRRPRYPSPAGPCRLRAPGSGAA